MGKPKKKNAGDALARAEAICRQRGVRLTALRRQVLEIVQKSPTPLGAYEVLGRMNAGGGRNAPPAAYRALAFLESQGFIHRIESLGAFVGCATPEEAHSAQFLICRDCGGVTEMPGGKISEAIDRAASQAGFQVERPVVEISGSCGECSDD